jgi:hypothetical protein
MQKSLRYFLVALGLVAAAAGCGGAQTTVETAASAPLPPPPPPVRALEKLLPEAAEAVARLDLVGLRQSASYALAEGVIKAMAAEDGAEPEPYLDLLGRTDEAWAALVAMQDGRRVPVFVARGDYREGDERAFFSGASEPPAVVQHGEFTVFTMGNGALAIVGTHTLIVGVVEHVEAALDLQASGDGSGPTDPALVSAMGRIGLRQATFAGAARATEYLLGELSVPPMLQSTVESGAFEITIGERVSAAVNVRTTGAMVAATLVTLVRGQLAELRGDASVAGLGLAPLFAGLSVANEAEDAWIRLDLAAADLEALARSLGAAFGVAFAP